MKKTNALSAVVLAALLLLPTMAVADDVAAAFQPRLEPASVTFRTEMLAYLTGMRQLPPASQEALGTDMSAIDRAEAAVRAMSDQDLAVLQATMNRSPYWRQVPAALGSISPRDIAMRIDTAPATAGVEAVRSTLKALISNFRSIPAERVDPTYQERINRVEEFIAGASAEELLQLGAEIQARTPQWNQQLAAAAEGRSMVSSDSVSAQNHCGQSFSGVICEINHIISAIGTFFTTTLPNYATGLINDLKNIFTNLVGALPTSVGQLANLIGLNSINWADVASALDTYGKLPCPAPGVNLPGFGVVGEIRTATNYAGTIGFAGQAIQDLTPSDIMTSANLQAITIVANFPVQWLGRCLQSAWEDNYSAMQKTHRDHVDTNLDVVASTRATQTSLDGTQAQTNDLDNDVAKVEGKLDALDAQLDRIEITSLRLDGKSFDLEDKIDNLQAQQGQTNDILDELRLHYLRMLIEADLLGSSNFKISLFQLPEQHGGFLEMAASIVELTLQKRLAAGVKIQTAVRDYNDAVASFQRGAYKAAYDSLRKAYSKSVQ
jgi:hypothetical protein